MPTALGKGIYPPVLTFFTSQEELDLGTLRHHIHRLAESGIAGYVVMGSNGEAVHLTDDERAQVIAAARAEVALQSRTLPLIAGCGAQSTRLTGALCQQAADAGADFALILPPFYYRGQMTQTALYEHYQTVAEQSPLPILIYNMPACAGGLDLDAEFIIQLAAHPNIVGVKDTSGNIVKLARIAAAVPADFQVFAGNADILLPSLASGAVGCVAAFANIFPELVCKVQLLFEQEKLTEASKLQASLIEPNAAVTSRYGVPGLKFALQQLAGYGGIPRRPLLPLNELEQQKVLDSIAPIRSSSD
ncbi:dihydrodipicolinate synthase family protein [Tengunoibacter tsumagoiensis]|nr:dihydrodipicolinate synthase family protein [Tengunoibacter tsumagoiensis]